MKKHLALALAAPAYLSNLHAEAAKEKTPVTNGPMEDMHPRGYVELIRAIPMGRIVAGLALAVACLVAAPFARAATQSTFSTEHLFGGATDAVSAAAGPTEFAGKLIGTTYLGGTDYMGAIYFYDPSVANYQTLFSFPWDGSLGTNPAGPLTNANGVLYGTTSKGGMYGAGTIFSFHPKDIQGSFTVYHHFTAAEGLDCFSGHGTDGDFPAGALVFKGAVLYGVRCGGGTNNMGTVYRMKPGIPSTFQSYSFTGLLEGRFPVGGLTLQGGKFYGVTWAGGTYPWTGGAVYSVDPAAPTITATPVYQFPIAHQGGVGTLGTNPSTALVYKQGYFYGYTDYGGQYNHGTVYKLLPGATWQNTVLHDVYFPADGDGARGQLTFVGNNLYGTAGWGAMGNFGTVWRLKVTNNTFNVIHYFSNTNDSSIAMSGLTPWSLGTDLFGASFGRGGTLGSIFRITTP